MGHVTNLDARHAVHHLAVATKSPQRYRGLSAGWNYSLG
jgi:hypothetical protein